MSLKHSKRTKKAPFYKKPSLIALAALLVLTGVIVLATLEHKGVINLFGHRYPGLATQPTTPNRTAGPSTKGEQPTPTDQNTPTPTPPSDESNKVPSNEPAGPFKEPSGTFVSNHHPNLSGSPSPNEIQSTCVTTSGATCTIVFSKDGVTKQLPVQNTDKEGAAYWSWKLQDIGLTTGTWKVQAKAVLGSQTKTTNDALDLEVKS